MYLHYVLRLEIWLGFEYHMLQNFWKRIIS